MPANASRFTEVVARERSRLGNFIRGQVRDAADAEDILQDVWLGVAKNRIVDRARKKKEEPLPAVQDEDGRSWLEETLPDPAAGPDAAYARSVLLTSIQAALQTLPPYLVGMAGVLALVIVAPQLVHVLDAPQSAAPTLSPTEVDELMRAAPRGAPAP